MPARIGAVALTGAERSRRYREAHPERHRAAVQRWREAHLEERRAYSRAHYAANVEARAAYQRDYWANDEHRYRRWERQLLARHGFTPDQWWALYDQQDGKCAICREPAGRLELDHDHSTGRRRGLLCVHCNRLLGHAKDSPAVLRAAAAFLEATA